MTDLGTLGGPLSIALSINDRGQVVGWRQTALGEDYAFTWQDGTMTDLAPLRGVFNYALGINNGGQIAGQSETTSGNTHAVLWVENK